MEWITSPESWIALLTLTVLEIILGIDNIVMISVLADRLPEEQRPLARKAGLGLALVTRVALLFSLAWLIGLSEPLFEAVGQEISGRDIILAVGGLFLVGKATHEIHADLEGPSREETWSPGSPTMLSVMVQIALLDAVFSVDSVLTAVGMAREIAVMVIAIVVAVIVMVVLIDPISRFITRHPTVKMLALSFLILIGVALIADAFEQHLPRPYIYFAFGFSVFVEALNLRVRTKRAERRKRSGKSRA